ncbi:MAG: hypothetical protein RJA34_1746 [Pseudomonadota bacterium]|jgi:hypothetical protein
MTSLARDINGQNIQELRPGTAQTLTTSGTSQQTAALTAGTRVVRVTATTDTWCLLGTNPTVTSANGTLLPAGAVEYWRVNDTDKIAVLQVSGAGSFNCVEAG